MTSTELKEKVRNRTSSSIYELDINYFLKQEVIQGIIQCLENQEKILNEIRELKNIRNNNE